MARVGLPTKSAKLKAARLATASLSRSRSTSSPTALVAVALGAFAFRVVSALVEAFAARLYAHAPRVESEPTFGIYRILVRLVDRWVGHWLAAPVTAPVVVSWIAFSGAMAMLLRVAQLDIDGERADGAVLLAAVFPFASVFGGHSAEALFLVCALGAFYGFRTGHWIAGGLCGAFATATLPAGILIVPALAWIGLRDSAARRISMLTGLALAVAGIAAYLSYLYYRGGPVGGWTASMSGWGFRLEQAPWTPLAALFTSHQPPLDAFNGVVTMIALATVPLVWWRLNGGYAIYMLAILLLPLMSASPDALGRACALLFPMFILAASIRWRVAVVLLAVTSAMLYVLANS